MFKRRIRTFRLTALLSAAVFGVALIVDAAVATPTAAENQVAMRAEELLSAYAANDQKAVLAMVDPQRLTIYGSDIAESINGGEAFGKMMTDEFALWKTAKLGPIQHLSVRVGGELATAFFNAPFSAGGQPPILVRFAKVDGSTNLLRMWWAPITTLDKASWNNGAAGDAQGVCHVFPTHRNCPEICGYF